MVRRELIEQLRCTVCSGTQLGLGSGRRPALRCAECDATFPIVDDIPDMIPPNDAARPGQYRTDTLPELVAGVYDVAAPFMSLAVWHCSPLRYVDFEHRAAGRAGSGVYLKAPIGTGGILGRVLAPYHDATIIGVDRSWKMLRRAQRRFEGDDRVHLVRGRLDALPLRDDGVDSIQSVNGLHGVNDRGAMLSELDRVAAPGAYVGGTALVRNQELLADAVLDRYERWGILPMLRTSEFIAEELRSAGFQNVHFETHGAVVFYSAAARRD